jgi:hypothetical protein
MVEFSGGDAAGFWAAVIEETLGGGYTGSSPLVIPKVRGWGGPTPHPSETAGLLVRHFGEIKGQSADWRGSIEGREEGFHALEYDDRYDCHIDSKDPFKDPVGHLVQDSAGTLAVVGVVAAVGILAALAYALSRDG